jgi:hypothetical protein
VLGEVVLWLGGWGLGLGLGGWGCGGCGGGGWGLVRDWWSDFATVTSL